MAPLNPYLEIQEGTENNIGIHWPANQLHHRK
jgi:hypothetical protein